MHVLPIIIDRQHMRYEPKERAEKKEKEKERKGRRDGSSVTYVGLFWCIYGACLATLASAF